MSTTATTNLSEHFTLREFLYSKKAVEHGIANLADHETLARGYKTAACMERVRNLLGKPIDVSSWFRSPEVNTLVGSKPTSQHPFGEAVDFTCPLFGTPLDICRAIIKNQDIIQFDQLILEHTWVHISFAIRSGKPKGQVLSLLASGGYAPGLTDKHGKPY